MFKFIKKIKGHDVLAQRVRTLESEVTALLSKAPIDLTRECLKILPREKDFDPEDAKYSSTDYLKNLAALADNNVFEEEVKKVIHEQTEYIATQSPSRDSDLLSRGTINGVILLLQRAKDAREFLDYKSREARGLADKDSE